MSPRPSRAAERRPQILEAAARVIAARGLDGTRLSDVAEEAGVSVGTVQHYFHSRSRLLMEAFAFVNGRAQERWLDAASEEPDPWGQLIALVEIVVRDPRSFRERWRPWLEFWAAYAGDPTLRPQLGEAYDCWREPMRRAILTGISHGLFRPRMPPEDIVDRTLAAFDGLALHVLLDVPGVSVERMRHLLVSGLAHDLGLLEP